MFTVNQKGAPCTLTLSSPHSSLIPGSGGTGTFDVMVKPGDCEWKAKTEIGSTWVHAAGGSGRVDYTVDKNAGARERNGRITVTLTLGKHSRSYTVKQGK